MAKKNFRTNQDHLVEENVPNFGLPDSWHETSPPAPVIRNVPSAPQSISPEGKYSSGTLPSVLGLEPDLVKTPAYGNSAPTYRLMPVMASGRPSIVSAAISANAPIYQPIQRQTTTNTTNIQNNTDAIQNLQATSFQGAWSNSVSYSQGASVDYLGAIYVSLIDGNIGNQPDTSPTDWVATGGADNYAGVWNSGSTYTTGQTVSVGSALYIALQNSTNKNPTSTAGYWQQLSSSSVYRGAYSGSAQYSVGDEVSYTDGNFYVCTTATSGNAPGFTSSFWTLLGTSAALIGGYSGSFAYKAGMQVTSGGGVFTALQATTGHAPPTPPSSNSFWSYIGPSDLSIVPDGTTRFGQTASGLSYRPTTNPLSSSDAGSNATITISAFTMRTSSKGDISISSGSITALTYGTLYFIYYDDASLAGGSVTFNATTTKSTALNGSGRFFVGSIFTAVAGGSNTIGNNDGGTGAQFGGLYQGSAGLPTPTNNGVGIPDVWTNLGNAIDGNTSTAAVLTGTGTSQGKSSTLVLSQFGLPNIQYSSLSLNCKSSCTTNSLSGGAASLTVSYSLDGGLTFTTWFQITIGNTRALTTDTLTLNVQQNVNAIQFKLLAAESSSTTSGTRVFNLYEVWVTGVV